MTEKAHEGETGTLSVNLPGEVEPGSVMSRRRAVGWILGVGGTAVGALLAIPLIRSALYPIFARSRAGTWSNVGSENQYASASTPMRKVLKIVESAGWQKVTSSKVVYVTKGSRRGSLGGIEVLTAVCPHLGCEVQWEDGKKIFYCPCHGSKFAPDGKYLGGPAPRSMDTLPIRVADGQLMVHYEYFRNLVPQKEVIIS